MTQQMTLEEGVAQRDEGMRQVATAAKSKDPLFAGQAYAMLSLYAATNHGTFTADDVIEFARSKGCIAPTTDKAWGPVFMRARKLGLIAFVGWEDSPKRHSSPGRVWRRVVI